jgi:oligopeptide transport system permease protein
MPYYFFKKGCVFVLSLWCIITITFFLMHALPGDPFIGDHPIPYEVLHSLKTYYGLDQPLTHQYVLYLERIVSFDLGSSIVYPGKKVVEIIREGFGASAILGVEALLFATIWGILLGSWMGLKRNQWQDAAAVTICALAISIPNFVLASLLQWLFCIKLHWLPLAYWGSFSHTILPALALAALPAASIAKLTRANLGDILEQDYIQTAKGKGLPMIHIVYRHGLRGTLLPVVAYLGPTIAHIVTGSLMIEKIFSIPGLGKWMISSIVARDYPMILGLTLFFSFFLMLSNFIMDMIYGLMDPRIRVSTNYE